MPPVIEDQVCTRCGICYDICPQDCFAPLSGDLPVVAFPKECWHCGACVMDCPVEAIHLELPLQMHMVPSTALYGPPKPGEEELLKRAAAFSRSVIK